MFFHYSEEPSIKIFVPRSPKAHPDVEALVWAIDEEHSPLYFFPRDCPRVSYWLLPTTTETDKQQWWKGVSGRMVLAIEFDWLERMRTTKLYRYCFEEDGFENKHDHGVHISRTTVIPKQVEEVGDLFTALQKSNVELRLCPSLKELGEEIIQTSLHFSLIRMRNAKGWMGPKGTPVV